MILIADDHRDSADVLGLVMEMHFSQSAVTITYGGPEALNRASSQRPDIALLDLEMPEIDGEELARALRTMFPDQAPLLVALSGNPDRLDQARGSGIFDRVMSKPIDIDALIRMVGKRLATVELGQSPAP